MIPVHGSPYARWLKEVKAKATAQGWGDIRSNVTEGRTVVITFSTGIQVHKSLDDFSTPEASPQSPEADRVEGTEDRYPGRFVNGKPCGWGNGNQMIWIGSSIMRVSDADTLGLTLYHGGEKKWLPLYHSEDLAIQRFRTDRNKRF
ncbi:hypothetical protein [Azospirillum sp. sgz301742]